MKRRRCTRGRLLWIEVTMATRAEAVTDPEDLAAIVEDVRRGLKFVRTGGQGYGEVVLRIQVRPKGIADWDVAPKFTRKPRRTSP